MEKPDLELPGGERPRPLRYRLLAHLVPIGHGQAELRQVAIRLTQVGAVGSTEWGGRPPPERAEEGRVGEGGAGGGGRPPPRGGPPPRFRGGGGGPPARSRGTAPPRRCQSDYLSQADSHLLSNCLATGTSSSKSRSRFVGPQRDR